MVSVRTVLDASIVVLGIGNLLASDDGVGVHVVQALQGIQERVPATLVDAGTISFPLLEVVASHEALVVVDAARLGEPPGTVRVIEGAAMDAFLASSKFRSVHDVSLAEILGAARLTGCLPERRALVGVQPATTELGTACSPQVARALPEVMAAVRELILRWHRVR